MAAAETAQLRQTLAAKEEERVAEAAVAEERAAEADARHRQAMLDSEEGWRNEAMADAEAMAADHAAALQQATAEADSLKKVRRHGGIVAEMGVWSVVVSLTISCVVLWLGAGRQGGRPG